MPKVTGPLMSIGASGTISKSLNYRQTKRGTIARIHSQPSGAPSSAQETIRAITKQVSQAWASVSEPDRTTWNELAEASAYSPFNAFFVVNFERVRTGQAITDVYPPAEAPPVADLIAVENPGPCTPDLSGNYYEDGILNGYMSYKRATLPLAYCWSIDGLYFFSPDYKENWDCYFEGQFGTPFGMYSGVEPAIGDMYASEP